MTVTGPAAGSTSSGGHTFVPSSGGVVTLNYYDGRFLRADDLNLEQRSLREYTELSNRASGPGPVWGFDLSGAGTAELRLSAGLALAAPGQVLYLPDDVPARVAELLGEPAPPSGSTPEGSSSGSSSSGTTGFAPCASATTPVASDTGARTVTGLQYYLVCLTPARRPQGVAEVVGRLCEGCVTATDSPYLADGVTLELRPVTLDLAPWTAPGLTRPDLHLRSQVASAYFARELATTGTPMGAPLLATGVWGAGAGSLAGDDAVLLGVLGWNGATIALLDPWTARRESMQPPPLTYWGGWLEQRPLPVFLAQVLQFQSQLAAAPPAPGGSVQQLLDRGFVELPPAGYLPLPGGPMDLRGTLAAQFGPGVELRLCAVRRDQIPGELEQARHLARISLLRGMRDAAAREQVDVLVPDGLLDATLGGLEFVVDLAFGPGSTEALTGSPQAPRGTALGRGAARWEPGPGIRVRFAAGLGMPRWGETFGRLLRGRQEGVSGFEAFTTGTRTSPPVERPDVAQLKELAGRVTAAAAAAPNPQAAATVSVAVGDFRVLAVAATLSVDADPFGLPDGATTGFLLEASGLQPNGRSSSAVLLTVSGRMNRVSGTAGGTVTATVSGAFGVSETAAAGQGGTFEDRPLVLTRTTGDGTTVTVTDPTFAVTVTLHWTGDPIRADLVVRTVPGTDSGGAGGEGGEPEQLAALTATEDPSVLRSPNPYHDSAASALAMVGPAHPDPQWAEHAYQALFPPGDTGVATVAAHHDWVLFRRRGRRDCEGTPVTPNPVDTVTVKVLAAKDEDDAKAAADAVLSGAAGAWPDSWSATEVVFEGGTTTLLTPAGSWQQRYRAAGGADVVALAGYAAAAGSLGALVGTGRLKALLAALPSEVSTAPGAPVALVNPPPAQEPATGTDGTVFLVTRPAAPARVPILAVRGLTTDDHDGAVARVKQPDATLAGDVEPIKALGEGGQATLDIDHALTELTDLVGDRGDRQVTVETVLWTFDPLPVEDAVALATLATSVEAAVEALPNTVVTVGARFAVPFTRTDEDLDAQLFLLATVAPQVE